MPCLTDPWPSVAHDHDHTQDILGQDPLQAYGFRSMDKFGVKLKPPAWFKDDEVGGWVDARSRPNDDECELKQPPRHD